LESDVLRQLLPGRASGRGSILTNLVSAKRTLTYSTNPTSAGERIESNPTGGVMLMPAALANLAETLVNGATGGAAAIRAGTRWP
jgi:hypothetical protein